MDNDNNLLELADKTGVGVEDLMAGDPHTLESLSEHTEANPDAIKASLDTGVDFSIANSVVEMTESEPRTLGELEANIGEDLSRDQVENRMDKMASSGIVNSKKGPGKTSSKIYWRG